MHCVCLLVSKGRCERTEERGDFPAETVYVLPTLTKPPQDILALFSVGEAHHGRRLNAVTNGGTETRERPHTLQDYALDHFRPPPKRTMSKALTLSSKRHNEDLWRYSREPLKQPLLKKIQAKEELAEEACFAFAGIMQFIY